MKASCPDTCVHLDQGVRIVIKKNDMKVGRAVRASFGYVLRKFACMYTEIQPNQPCFHRVLPQSSQASVRVRRSQSISICLQ